MNEIEAQSEATPQLPVPAESASSAIPADAGRLPSMPKVAAGWRIPGAATARIQRWARSLRQVTELEESTRRLTLEQIRKESLSLRYRAMSGEPLVRILPEAFALVREAGRRALNMRHFDV